MIREIVDRILGVNQLIEATMTGRNSLGNRWADQTWAVELFNDIKGLADDYSKFDDNEYYLGKLERDIRYKEVESPGYVSRVKKYFDKYAPGIYRVNYQTLKKGAFISDLLADGYISQEEADEYVYLVAKAYLKIAKYGWRAYKIILDIADPKVETRTPALDFLFHPNDGLRDRFISFFKSGHLKLKITASDVVQILFFAIKGRSRFDALEKNGFSPKYLWSDLRMAGVLGDTVKDVSDRALNIAAQKALPPKPDVKAEWESFK